MSILGERIKHLRKQKKLSIATLGELTKSTRGYIWQLENGVQKNPSADKLLLLSFALDITIDALISPFEMSESEISPNIIIRKFKKLCVKDQKRIEKIMDNWLKE